VSSKPLAAVAAAVLALVLAAPADAHVTLVRSSGGALTVRVPNERDVPTTRLALTAPAGVRLAAAPARGWRIRTAGSRVVWSGGAVPARGYAELAARVSGRAGGRWSVEQGFADGATQPWTPALSAPHATGAGGGGGLMLAVVPLGFVLAAALWLARPRRRAAAARA
jgi:hypothetical protein